VCLCSAARNGARYFSANGERGFVRQFENTIFHNTVLDRVCVGLLCLVHPFCSSDNLNQNVKFELRYFARLCATNALGTL
jgi:hypothetical protein